MKSDTSVGICAERMGWSNRGAVADALPCARHNLPCVAPLPPLSPSAASLATSRLWLPHSREPHDASSYLPELVVQCGEHELIGGVIADAEHKLDGLASHVAVGCGLLLQGGGASVRNVGIDHARVFIGGEGGARVFIGGEGGLKRRVT